MKNQKQLKGKPTVTPSEGGSRRATSKSVGPHLACAPRSGRKKEARNSGEPVTPATASAKKKNPPSERSGHLKNREPKIKPLTQWSEPDEIIRSGYGDIPYSEWCEREIQRIARHGKTVRIHKRKEGMIALVR